MTRLILYLLFAFLPALSFSQGSGEPLDWGARSQAMGNASIALNGPWAMFQNQAGLVAVERFSAGVFYQSRYAIAELATAGAGVALPAAGGVFGLTYVQYGYSGYREQRAGLAYARKLGENFDVGIQFDYIGVAIGGIYGSTGAFTFQGGARYQLSDDLALAVHVFNPVRAQLADFNDERLPSVLRFGALYALSERVNMTAEVRKHIDHTPLLAAGLEYEVLENFFVRGGASGAPSRFTFGMGYQFGDFIFDISSAYNEVLGYSPQLSLMYNGR